MARDAHTTDPDKLAEADEETDVELRRRRLEESDTRTHKKWGRRGVGGC